MKKILLFLFPFLFVACSSDEPNNESLYVEDSDSNTEVIGCFTLTYIPCTYDRVNYDADIICEVEDGVKAVPQCLFVRTKNSDASFPCMFSHGFSNLLFTDDGYYDPFLRNNKLGTQSFTFGMDKVKFSDVKEIELQYLYSEEGETKGGVYIVYGDGKKCNKILRSYFK